MVKHLLTVLAPYVLPLILAGIGIMIPEDTPIKIYIAYGCFILAGLILCWAAFKDIKSYLKKRKDIKAKKEEPLPKEPRVYDILDDCIWEANPGWYRNPITKELFCCDCWDDFKIKKHLIEKSLSEWFCPKCNKPYNSRARMWINLFTKKPITSRIR